MINYKIDNFKEEIKDKKSIISETFDGYSECFDLNNNDIRYIKDYLYENQ